MLLNIFWDYPDRFKKEEKLMNDMDYLFPLFVPASKPKLITKAWASGADSVIIDLEDAVAPADKEMARENVIVAMEGKPNVPTFLRVNASGTKWYNEDVALLSSLSFEGVMLPKTESVDTLKNLRRVLNDSQKLISLIETAKGMVHVNEIAHHCDRLAFGSIDYSSDLDSEHTQKALLFARSTLVLASRAAGISPPLDGVTTTTKDLALIEQEAAHSCELGFKGKLLIHPTQIKPTHTGFMPSKTDLAWAERIMQLGNDGAAAVMDGAMVDAPVVKRAQNILAKKDLFK